MTMNVYYKYYQCILQLLQMYIAITPNVYNNYSKCILQFVYMHGTIRLNIGVLFWFQHIDEYGATPLHEAVIYNHLAVVRMLIDHGAEVTLSTIIVMIQWYRAYCCYHQR